MLKTYIGQFKEGVEVFVLGVPFGVVKPGESIVVPDDLAEKATWGEDIWKDGPAPGEDKDKSKGDKLNG